MISAGLMGEQLQRLNDVFPKFTPGSDAFKRLAYAYAEAFRDADLQEIVGGVSLAIAQADRFPPPAKLREYCRDWLKANRVDPIKAREAAQGEHPGCVLCGAVPRWGWHRRDDGSEYSRMVLICDRSKHPAGTRYNGTPPNFIGWDDTPPPPPGAWRDLLRSLSASFEARRV